MADTNTAAQSQIRDTLAAATALEKTLRGKYPDTYGKKAGFEGYGYGKDQYVCTTFASKVLAKAGYQVAQPVDQQINIAINWEKETGKKKPTAKDKQKKLASLVSGGDPRTKGVVLALVNSDQGVEIGLDQLRPGDFVQYWYDSKGKIAGHVVQVVEVVSTGEKIKAHGSHGSKHGVGTINVTLTGKKMKRVYAVRPKFSQAK